MENKQIFTLIESPLPLKLEQEERNKNKLCQYCEINTQGDYYYTCQNHAKSYKIKYKNLNRNIWINDAMLCQTHLTELSKKYEINFSEEIPKLYLDKDWAFDLDSHLNNNCPNRFPKLLELEKTKLHKSLVKQFIKNEEDYRLNFCSSEMIWFMNPFYAISIPRRFWNSLILYDSALSKSSSQGKINGPDFIFINDSKDLIGLEIVSFKWNISNTKSEKASILFANNNVWNETNLDNKISKLKKILEEKANKSKKYFKCKELFLGIVTGDVLMKYEYFLLEIIINDINKKNNYPFKSIFII